MAFSTSYIFGFSAGVCVVCSLLVSGAAISLKDKQDLNKERDLKGNILAALQVTDPASPPSGEEIDVLWSDRVNIRFLTPSGQEAGSDADLNGDGTVDLEDVALANAAVKGTDQTPAVLALYERNDDGAVGAYAFPVSGKGLWGPLTGYIALKADLSAVMGVTCDAPKETPGLGAEIMADAFKDQWVGKSIFKDGQPFPIQVAKGPYTGSDTSHWVDGISGATLTCRGVNGMLESGVAQYKETLLSLKK